MVGPIHFLARPMLRLKTKFNKISTYQYRKDQRKGWKEVTDTDRASEYFESIYPKIYGDEWKFIKQSLLKESKYVALVNNFSENEAVIEKFEKMGAFEIGAFYTKTVKHHVEKIMSKKISKLPQLPNFKDIPDVGPSRIRPSKIDLTDDEKAALVDQGSINHYPDIYKQKALNAGIFSGALDISKPSSSRKLEAATIDGTNISNIYDYVPSNKLLGLEDWIEEGDIFLNANEPENEIGVKRTIPKEAIKWPQYLKAYSFVTGDKESTFPSPHDCTIHGICPHYLLNGASLLPVLALDLQPQDKVLDLCASPGGKSLAILQTCLPYSLVCNDVTGGRTQRIVNVLDEFISERLDIRKIVEITKFNGCLVYYEDTFDKVLVDVPCLNDRLSLHEPTENIFKTSRIKERLRMPEVQAQLLINSIKAVKPGGSVVYSTCTLSPLQNDGAVHLALTRIWRETHMECVVVDLRETVRHLKFIYRLGQKSQLRYGSLVLPNPDQNFGPMYVCKIIRNK